MKKIIFSLALAMLLGGNLKAQVGSVNNGDMIDDDSELSSSMAPMVSEEDFELLAPPHGPGPGPGPGPGRDPGRWDRGDRRGPGPGPNPGRDPSRWDRGDHRGPGPGPGPNPGRDPGRWDRGDRGDRGDWRRFPPPHFPPPYFPPTYSSWTCIANDRGWEEHFGGHAGYGNTQYEAADNAMYVCLQSHGECYISSCY